jgi:hypothetical protein
MTATHTPGPWFWTQDRSGYPTSLRRSGSGEVVIQPDNTPGEHAWVDVSEADAALIAAAPDLLEALTALRDEVSGVDQWWGKLREAADAADAAIRKASPTLTQHDSQGKA